MERARARGGGAGGSVPVVWLVVDGGHRAPRLALMRWAPAGQAGQASKEGAAGGSFARNRGQ